MDIPILVLVVLYNNYNNYYQEIVLFDDFNFHR